MFPSTALPAQVEKAPIGGGGGGLELPEEKKAQEMVTAMCIAGSVVLTDGTDRGLYDKWHLT